MASTVHSTKCWCLLFSDNKVSKGGQKKVNVLVQCAMLQRIDYDVHTGHYCEL